MNFPRQVKNTCFFQRATGASHPQMAVDDFCDYFSLSLNELTLSMATILRTRELFRELMNYSGYFAVHGTCHSVTIAQEPRSLFYRWCYIGLIFTVEIRTINRLRPTTLLPYYKYRMA